MSARIAATRMPERHDWTGSRSLAQVLKRHPVVAYYTLTFLISWGGLLWVIGGPAGLPARPGEAERLMPFAIPFMLLGPSIAGVVMTGLTDGVSGYRELFARLRTWRVDLKWYGVALLLAPVVFVAVLAGLSLSSPVYLPGIVTTSDKTSFLAIGLASALMVGFFEELGWTGFAIPRLRRSYGVLRTGLLVGVLWAVWHLLPVDLWGGGASAGEIPLGLFITVNGFGLLIGQLPPFRMLMVWVYERTDSLLVAVLMHTSLAASTFILGPIGITAWPLLIYGFAVAVAMWLMVGLVAMTSSSANREYLTDRRPSVRYDGGAR